MARAISSYMERAQLPGALPVIGAAAILILAAGIAALLPATRAARVDVVQRCGWNSPFQGRTPPLLSRSVVLQDKEHQTAVAFHLKHD